MLSKFVDLFSKPADYLIPYQPERIYDVFCECNAKRCFGYTPQQWRKALRTGL